MFRSVAHRYFKVYWSSIKAHGWTEISIPLVAAFLHLAYAGARGHLIPTDRLCTFQVVAVTFVWFVCLKGLVALFICSRKVHEERLADPNLAPRIIVPHGTRTGRHSVSWLPEIVLSGCVAAILCLLAMAAIVTPDFCVAKVENASTRSEQSGQIQSSTVQPPARQLQPAIGPLAYPWLSFSMRNVVSDEVVSTRPRLVIKDYAPTRLQDRGTLSMASLFNLQLVVSRVFLSSPRGYHCCVLFNAQIPEYNNSNTRYLPELRLVGGRVVINVQASARSGLWQGYSVVTPRGTGIEISSSLVGTFVEGGKLLVAERTQDGELITEIGKAGRSLNEEFLSELGVAKRANLSCRDVEALCPNNRRFYVVSFKDTKSLSISHEESCGAQN